MRSRVLRDRPFDLTPASVRRAIPQSRRLGALRQLNEFRGYVAGLSDNAITVSSRLNQPLHRDLLLGVVDHLVACLEDATPRDATP